MHTNVQLVLLLAAATVAGCEGAEELPGPRAGEAFVTEARTDAELMQVIPDVVAPGGELEAVFPSGADRGPGFVLERRGEEGWEWRFAISSDVDAPDMVNVITAEAFVADNYDWDSGPGFDGTDPHPIPVPAAAETGSWRVCTAPGTPGLCAEFEVTDEP